MNVPPSQYSAFVVLLNDLERDIGTDYLILALKKISDQQMLFLDFSKVDFLRDPILKVLDEVIREIDVFIYESPWAVESPEQLKGLIQMALIKLGVA